MARRAPRRLVLALAALALPAWVAGLLLRSPGAQAAPAPDKPLRSRVSCKAVTRLEEARGCASIEIDLTAAKDGAWVLAHDPVTGGVDIPGTDSSRLGPSLVAFRDFVAGLKAAGARLDLVDLDIKDHSLWPGRLAPLLEANRPALEELAGLSERTVYSTTVFFKLAEIDRFLSRTGLGARGAAPGLDILDYTPEAVRRWGLPLTPWEARLLPAAKAVTRLYERLHRGRIPYLAMQESTARSWPRHPAIRVLCWTRDPAGPEVPAPCLLAERRRES